MISWNVTTAGRLKKSGYLCLFDESRFPGHFSRFPFLHQALAPGVQRGFTDLNENDESPPIMIEAGE